MKLVFSLRVWHPVTEALLLEVASEALDPDDVRDLLHDVMPDDPELVGAVYRPKPGAEAELARLFGVEALAGDYQISRERA